MKILSAILVAIIITGGYYLLVHVIDKKYELNFHKKKICIIDKTVIWFGVFTLIGSGVTGYFRLSHMVMPQAILTVVIICAMAVLAILDKCKNIVPNKILLIMLGIWVAVVGVYILLDIMGGIALFAKSLMGGIVGGITFLMCYLLSGKKVGAGDVKLSFVMGLFLTGDRIIGAIFYGTLVCCIYSIILLFRKKIGLKDGVPMVPFLYIGVLITLFII